MGRWRRASSFSSFLLLFHFSTRKASTFCSPSTSITCNTVNPGPLKIPSFLRLLEPFFNAQGGRFSSYRTYSTAPSLVQEYGNDIESGSNGNPLAFAANSKDREDEEEAGKIPVKAYFLCTSIDLKRMQAENLGNVVSPTTRSTNYIALRYYDFPPEIPVFGAKSYVCCRYMVVFQYGSAVLFNIEDREVEAYLDIVREYASGVLLEMRKDDYAIKEKPLLAEDMEGGPDYLILKALDTDSIRIIGSVLGQSIALEYYVSQVDGMVEEFAGINRAMEQTGTFTMDRKKLLQLVGKANSNLADVILKVGLFERSEIAWRTAKYAQIYEYLREEYEVTQRFGNLDFKLKFVEHNIHFLQEVIQNRRSDLLEWLIIFLLSVENIISIYEIVHG